MMPSIDVDDHGNFIKLGGLDSRDQSRSSCLDLSRSVFETCQETLDCWDTLFLSRSRLFKNWY